VPTTVLSAEDNFRTQPSPRRSGLYLARPPRLEPFRRADPSEDVWLVPRDPASVVRSPDFVEAPRGCTRLDAGVCLAVEIGTSAADTSFVVALDVVRRDVPDAQATLARSWPTHTPVSGDRIPLADHERLDELRLRLYVNGSCRQDGRATDFVAAPTVLLDSIRRRIALHEGDLVLTGTPPGLAIDHGGGWLQPGDEMVAVIDGIGELRTVVAPADAAPLPRRPSGANPRVFVTGTNYQSHVDEMGGSRPTVPTANLLKGGDAVCNTGVDVPIPAETLVDYEGEIGIVIGSSTAGVSSDDVDDAVVGFCLANDITARDAPTTHLSLAKNGRRFCPLGPVVSLPSARWNELAFTVRVNGEVRQCGHAHDMVHSIREIVASYSAAIALEPGDVILTGSPAGVGLAQDPPVFLQDGDTVEIESPQLGKLVNRFVAAPGSSAPPAGRSERG
jgi:acylpyruvate hydrolase